MKTPVILGLSLLVCVAAGCGRTVTTAVDQAALSQERSSAETLHRVPKDIEARNFRAHLSGREEVPPVRTKAQGQAVFHLSKDGTAIYYKLIVANIEDVTAAHIHLAPAKANGPVVVGLLSAPPGGGRVQGVQAKGVITAADLVGPLAGMPLKALVHAMADDGAYVNVHTVANPGGEVRGQIH